MLMSQCWVNRALTAHPSSADEQPRVVVVDTAEVVALALLVLGPSVTWAMPRTPRTRSPAAAAMRRDGTTATDLADEDGSWAAAGSAAAAGSGPSTLSGPDQAADGAIAMTAGRGGGTGRGAGGAR